MCITQNRRRKAEDEREIKGSERGQGERKSTRRNNKERGIELDMTHLGRHLSSKTQGTVRGRTHCCEW
jgi:hypothetical protein